MSSRPPRVPGLPIRDCARGCNNRVQKCAYLSTIDVTARTFFERLYLVLRLRKIAPWVNCSYASTSLIIHCTTISRFLCSFCPRTAPQFFSIMIYQVIWPSPGTARSAEDETRHAELNGNRNPECWGDFRQQVKIGKIKFLGISRYKVKLRFWLDLNSEICRGTNSNWDFFWFEFVVD